MDRNQTNITMICEIEGLLQKSYSDSIFAIIKPDVNGRYCRDKMQFYVPDNDGILEPFFKDNQCFDIPFLFDFCTSNDKNLLGMCKLDIGTIDEAAIQVFDRSGKTVAKYNPSVCINPSILLTNDGSVICLSYEDGDIDENNSTKDSSASCSIIKIDTNGSVDWKYGPGTTYVKFISPVNNCIYIGSSVEDCWNYKIMCLNFESGLISEYCLLHDKAWWYHFGFGGNGEVYLCNGDDENAYLTCLDKDLHELGMRKLAKKNIKHVELLYNEDATIYLHWLDDEICAVDAAKLIITAEATCYEDFNLLCTDKAGNLVVRRGEDTLEVFDSNLSLLSRHQVKGQITACYKNAVGNPCVVTYLSDSDQLDIKPDYAGTYTITKDSWIRIYELNE